MSPPFASLGNSGTRVSLRFDSRLDLEAQITSLAIPELLSSFFAALLGLRAGPTERYQHVTSHLALAALEQFCHPPSPCFPPVILSLSSFGHCNNNFFFFILVHRFLTALLVLGCGKRDTRLAINIIVSSSHLHLHLHDFGNPSLAYIVISCFNCIHSRISAGQAGRSIRYPPYTEQPSQEKQGKKRTLH